MNMLKPLSSVITLSISLLYSALPCASVNDYLTLSGFLGGRLSDELQDSESDQTAIISDNFAQALALSWYYSRNKEGELLFSSAKQSLAISADKHVATDIRISYLHFGGRVLFTRKGPFSNSLGVGLGATIFVPDNSRYDNEIKLSANITGGVRYEFNKQWALRSDLRVYGTLSDSNSALFCEDGQCLLTVKGEIYMQTDLMAGIEYKF